MILLRASVYLAFYYWWEMYKKLDYYLRIWYTVESVDFTWKKISKFQEKLKSYLKSEKGNHP